MVERVLRSIEDAPLTPVGLIAGLLSLMTVRFVLEVFTAPSGNGFIPLDLPTLVHYLSYFLALYLVITLIVGAFTRDYLKTSKVILSGFLVIWIPPLVDLVVTGGQGNALSYVMTVPEVLLSTFVSFPLLFVPLDTALGLRVAVVLLIVFVVWYVYRARKNIWLSILAALSVYGAVFMAGSLPSILYAIAHFSGATITGVMQFLQATIIESGLVRNLLPGTVIPATPLIYLQAGFNALITAVFVPVIAVAGTLLLTKIDARAVRAHFKNTRPLRIFHFLFLVTLGAFFGYANVPYGWPDALTFLNLLFAFIASCVFAICINDVEDEAIDVISNKERPLATGALSAADMKTAAFVAFFFMILAGWSAGWYSLIFLLSFTAAYYVYSASPLRLKRIPLFSSFIIGFAALSAVCAGFFFTSPLKTFGAFPTLWAVGIVVFYGLFSGFRDLKDIKGDTAGGVPTVATIVAKRFGKRAAYSVTGILAGLGFLSTLLFFPIANLAWVAVPAAFLAYLICVRTPYREYLLFILLFVFLAGAFLVA